MARQKTYLTHERQWDLTVEAVCRQWPLVDEVGPSPYGLSNPDPRGYPVCEDSPGRPDNFMLLQARRNHRLFLCGDVLLGWYGPNNVRQWVWGVSGRGYRLDTYFIPLFRQRAGSGLGPDGLGLEFLTDRVPVVWLRVPDRLLGLHPADPEVRAYVLGTLRAGNSVSG
jgi:hypothetical protein